MSRKILLCVNLAQPSITIVCFRCQAMYAAVHDAALVIGKATENFLKSADGEGILLSYRVNRSCPLRNTKNEDMQLGKRMLNEIKKVRSSWLLIASSWSNGELTDCFTSNWLRE